MARKGWEALSDSYRDRLTKGGVTRERYESGDSLAKARGHQSTAYERAQSKAYRDINRWVDRFAKTYGRDPDDVREALTAHGRAEAENVIRYQSTMEKAFDRGQTERASAMYKAPPSAAYPDWMFYYHGSFH